MRKVKKKKLSTKKIVKVFIPLIILIILLININNITYFIQSKITGYDFKTVEILHDYKIYKQVKKHEYSETLEKIINTEYYNKKYLDEYLDIEYKDSKSFNNDINTLISKGYKANDINNIYKSLKEEDINLLLTNNYLKDISNILSLNYFDNKKLERYLKYNEKNKLDYIDLITYVNIGLDNEYYTEVTNIQDTDNILILVNKYNVLSNTYVPSDLEAINKKYNYGWNNMLRHEARIAFEEMAEAALKDNITIYSGSAYRSYSYQANLYNKYVAQDGKAKADTFSARAGYSEHQTGLATDIMNAKYEYISKDDKEYTWLVNNSYKYGYILRYQEDTENITGYMYEEWHYRYVGKDVAKELYKQGITLDEYIARK